MLKAVFSFNVSRDRFLLVLEQDSENTYKETVIGFGDNATKQQSERCRLANSGYLKSQSFCGGRLTAKYEAKIRDALSAFPVLWNADGTEWIAPVEVWDNLPRVVRMNGGCKEARPSLLGVKKESVLGGALSPADYVNGSRSRD
jgi:hypothetical protein